MEQVERVSASLDVRKKDNRSFIVRSEGEVKIRYTIKRTCTWRTKRRGIYVNNAHKHALSRRRCGRRSAGDAKRFIGVSV